MDYWMFKPTSDFSHSFEWKTDVIRSKTSEQRIALRALPRVQYNFKHVLNRYEYSVAKSIFNTGVLFKVPDWTLKYTINASVGSGIVLNIGAHHFKISDEAIFWFSDNTFEITTVSAVTSNSITVNSVGSSGPCLLMKVMQSYITDSSFSVSNSGFVTLNSSADSIYPSDFGTYTPTLYSSNPLFPFDGIIESSLSEKVIWPTEIIDSSLGFIEVVTERTKSDSTFTLRCLLDDNLKLSVYQWLQYVLGKQKKFFVSSGHNDMPLAANASSSATTIQVFGEPHVSDFSNLQLTLPNGSKSNHLITNRTLSSPINGKSTMNISISPGLPASISVASSVKLSALYLARQDTDRIEIQHDAFDSPRFSFTINCLALQS